MARFFLALFIFMLASVAQGQQKPGYKEYTPEGQWKLDCFNSAKAAVWPTGASYPVDIAKEPSGGRTYKSKLEPWKVGGVAIDVDAIREHAHIPDNDPPDPDDEATFFR
jgi:hypothetical protein